MSDVLKEIQGLIYRRDHPKCPHCDGEIDMTDSDRLRGHVTYWGEVDPVEETCPHCEKPVFIQEHVERSWTVGADEEEARGF